MVSPRFIRSSIIFSNFLSNIGRSLPRITPKIIYSLTLWSSGMMSRYIELKDEGSKSVMACKGIPTGNIKP